MSGNSVSGAWPALADWVDTQATLHMWTQIIGKVRLALAPPMNHWWQVTLYVTARGLSTSPMPLADQRTIEIIFDFTDHVLRLECSDGGAERIALKPQSVAAFYAAVMAALRRLGVEVHIWTRPCEIEDPILFEKDDVHASYDPAAAHRFWLALVQADRVLKVFRGRFLGKASPVHFFWGSFDLAVTRFSGRRAPKHPSSPLAPASITEEAYSHEVSSCGFWPGAPGMPALFYAYAYPEPAGFAEAKVAPEAARWDATLGEFVLPYEAVRSAADPDAALMAFLQTTYEAAADLAHWARGDLERQTETVPA
jgi:hypothetical protein